MWQWPWMLALSFSFALWIGFNPSQTHIHFFTPALASGPDGTVLSHEQSLDLFEKGKKSFEKKQYEESISPLKAYLERNPGAPHFFEAHLLLGRSLLALKKFNEALPYFKAYVESTPATHPQAIWVRLDLGEAYLQSHHPSLAYLTSLEIEKLQEQHAPSPEAKIKALLLKGRSSLRDEKRTQKEEQARLILSSLEASALSLNEELRAQTQSFKLEYKLYQCSRFFLDHPLTEQQIKDQYERQGICLMEALNLYHLLLQFSDQKTLGDATNGLKKLLSEYSSRGQSPPLPGPSGSRSPSQKLKEQAELKDLLLRVRSNQLNELSTTLKLWRKTSSPQANPYIHDLLLLAENFKK